MKRLLFVMLSLVNGGAERSLVNLLNELPQDKYKIDLLLFRKEGMFLSQVPEWVTIIEPPKRLRNLYSPVAKSGAQIVTKVGGTAIARAHEKDGYAKAAYRWIHFYRNAVENIDTEYDVAIAYGSCEIMYFVADKVRAKKKIVWVHNDYRKAGHPVKYDRAYFGRVDDIVSISDGCVDILKEIFPEYSDKMHCIENITSSVVIKRRADEFIPQEYDEKKCKILSIGRLTEQKGFDLAIEAAKIFANRNIDFIWYVIGNGELQKELEELIKNYDLTHCFKLLGARENPYPYIKGCDIFAQTSRWEGKSVVLDEAKILTKPILVTNYPTVRDQIKDGHEGIIVEMNAEAIAVGLEGLISNDGMRTTLIDYLGKRDYGKQDEVNKYIKLFDQD